MMECAILILAVVSVVALTEYQIKEVHARVVDKRTFQDEKLLQHQREVSLLKNRLDQYKDQIQLLKAVNEKNGKVLSIKNAKILDLVTEVNTKNEQIEQLNVALMQGCQSWSDRNRNNKLAFNYIMKKQENKTLKHDIKVYNEEIQRLDDTIQALLVRMGSIKAELLNVHTSLDNFENEWMLNLETHKAEIAKLKKTILKKHIQISARITQKTTREFVELQMQLNQELDNKNKQLDQAKETFKQNIGGKNRELVKLVGRLEKEFVLPHRAKGEYQPTLFHPNTSSTLVEAAVQE